MRAMGKRSVLFGVVGALAAVSAASAGGSSTPGVTAKQILIGGTTPLSGPASAYAAVAKGADAYFKYVNDHGGVFGRSIKYKYDDDAYDPSQTIEKTRDLGKKAKLIVSKQGYDVTDTDVKSQIARLKSKRVKTLMVFATPKFAIQSYSSARLLGWRPLVFVNVVASASNTMTIAALASSKRQTEGSISLAFLKDPINPRWANDKAVKLFKTILKKYNGGEGLTDYYNVYGMSSAFTLVDALKHAGKNPTRASVMRAVTHLDERNNPFVLPGIVVKTTPTNRFPITQARLERYHNGSWVYFGSLVHVG